MIQLFSMRVTELLTKVDQTQRENMNKASSLIYESMKKDGLLHIFCTGHSHMIAEELIKMGKDPAILRSIYAPNGDKILREAFEQYEKLGY